MYHYSNKSPFLDGVQIPIIPTNLIHNYDKERKVIEIFTTFDLLEIA